MNPVAAEDQVHVDVGGVQMDINPMTLLTMRKIWPHVEASWREQREGESIMEYGLERNAAMIRVLTIASGRQVEFAEGWENQMTFADRDKISGYFTRLLDVSGLVPKGEAEPLAQKTEGSDSAATSVPSSLSLPASESLEATGTE